MEKELDKFDDSFIACNVVLSILAMLLSIIPSFVMWFLCAWASSMGNHAAYFYLLIPAAFYIMWICVCFVADEIKDHQNLTKKTPLFLINIFLTIPLFIFYLYIFIRLRF